MKLMGNEEERTIDKKVVQEQLSEIIAQGPMEEPVKVGQIDNDDLDEKDFDAKYLEDEN